jgi:hypothetical protein
MLLWSLGNVHLLNLHLKIIIMYIQPMWLINNWFILGEVNNIFLFWLKIPKYVCCPISMRFDLFM